MRSISLSASMFAASIALAGCTGSLAALEPDASIATDASGSNTDVAFSTDAALRLDVPVVVSEAAARDATAPDGSTADVPVFVRTDNPEYSLEGLPPPCGPPFWAKTPTAAEARRVLYVSPSGSDANNALTPPCPMERPCRQIGPLFARTAGAPNDRTMCDGTMSTRRYLSILAPGDLVLVADGEYQPFEIRQACGTQGAPISVVGTGGNAVIRGGIPMPQGEGGIWRNTVFVRSSRHIILDRLQMLDSGTAGVGMFLDANIVLRNLRVGNHGEFPVFTSFVNDLVIEHSDIFGGVRQHGIYISNSNNRVVVARNFLHDNAAAGMQVNPDNSADFGMPPEFPFTAMTECMLIDGNTIYNNGTAGGGSLNLQGMLRTVVRNNLIYQSLTTGIVLYLGDARSGSSDVHILHNTIDVTGTSSRGGRYGIHLIDLAGPVTLRNNIVFNRLNRAAFAISGTADEPRIDSDYNSWGSAGTVIVRNEATTGNATTLAQWQALGKDTHSIQATMTELVTMPHNGTTSNYHLAATSRARGAGTPSTRAGVGLENGVRAVPPDLGAY